MPVWLERFAARGGNLLIQDVGVAELEALAQNPTWSSGRRQGGLFERDAARSRFDKPQRALALTYVHGLAPSPRFLACPSTWCPASANTSCSPR